MEDCGKETDGTKTDPSSPPGQALDQRESDEHGEESKQDEKSTDVAQGGETGGDVGEEIARTAGVDDEMPSGEGEETPLTSEKLSTESDNNDKNDSLSREQPQEPPETASEVIENEDSHDNSEEGKPSDDRTLPGESQLLEDEAVQSTPEAEQSEAVLEDKDKDDQEQDEQIVATQSNEDEGVELEEAGSTVEPEQKGFPDEEDEKNQEDSENVSLPSESIASELKDAHESELTPASPDQLEPAPQEDSLDDGKDESQTDILQGSTETESEERLQETSECEKLDSARAESPALDDDVEKMDVTETAEEANTSAHLEENILKETEESEESTVTPAVQSLSDTNVDQSEETGAHETSELESNQKSSDLVESMDTSSENIPVDRAGVSESPVVESAVGEQEGRETGLAAMEDDQSMDTAVEADGQLEASDAGELSGPPDRVGQESDMVDGGEDEPMDMSQDEEQGDVPQSFIDSSAPEDVSKDNDDTAEANQVNAPEIAAGTDTESAERILSASDDNNTPAPSDVPNAESLVRGKDLEGASSVKVKQEILTDVLEEQDTTRDIKPSRQELDRSLEQSQEREQVQEREQQGEEDAGGDAGGGQGKGADGRKNNKGSSITSIVGRLFTKKEEEARKMRETSPEKKPEEEIANVPFKISGVKSLASGNQAARQQQRQEKRQTSSALVISNVTSLASGVEKCSRCQKQIDQPDMAYKWQKEKFCTFSCLDTTRLISTKTITCDACSVVLHQRVRNIYFAKVGKEYREFCSDRCSKTSEESPKLCPGCGKDVSASGTAILAQAGGTDGIFFEFCNQDCVNKYEETIINDENKDPEIVAVKKSVKDKCSSCDNFSLIRYEFIFHQDKKVFCCEACFDLFRMKHNTRINKCSKCTCMCYNDTSALLDTAHQGKKYFFCSKKCKNISFKACPQCLTTCLDKVMVKGPEPHWRSYSYCSVECRDKYVMLDKDNYTPTQPKSPRTLVSQMIMSKAQPPALAPIISTIATQPSLPPLIPVMAAAPPIIAAPQSISSSNFLQQQQQQQQIQHQMLPMQTAPQSQLNTNPPANNNPQATKCDHCSKVQRPLYHLTMSDHTLRNFCSYNCVISFQSQFSVPPVTLPSETLLLRCHMCQRGFNSRPLVLDYEDKTSIFCGETCLEDFKRTQCVFIMCDQCHQDKILWQKTYFCGEARSFCSQGCMLIYKQEIVQMLGLQCVVCDYCAQMCKKHTMEVIGDQRKYFCKQECKENYEKWYHKVARCDGCKNMGRQLKESFKWRGDMKKVCNEQCLLLFYTQQNIPNVTTQLPEPIPTSTAEHSTPTIAKVMSMAPVEKLGPVRSYTEEPKKFYTNKQTQITTNTVYIKPPPPPPSTLPPAPKMVKNKITMCKPIQITKATMCRPITKETASQTDFPKVPSLVPVPVPVFIPVPMQMYTTPVPYPICIPVPVATPVFIPVASRDCSRLLKTIEEIKSAVPSDPLEAELFMMAAAVADEGDDKSSVMSSERDASLRESSVSGKESFGGVFKESFGGGVKESFGGGIKERASLVDQAMVECGLMDEPLDDMGVNELLDSLSSPDVADDILLMSDGDIDDDAPQMTEKQKLEVELSQGLNLLGDILEAEGDPAPPPDPQPTVRKVKRITLKRKKKKPGRRPGKKKKGPATAPAPPPAPPPDAGMGLRRSSRSTKRTKYFNTEEEVQEEAEEEDEYEPDQESSSEEEIIEMEEEVEPEPPAAPYVPEPVRPPPTDDSWIMAGVNAFKLFAMSHNEATKSAALQLKPDILECPPDMLHRGLILFVRNFKQPNGQSYPPEIVLLFCLSIQRFVTDSGRMENFLIGPNFDQFRVCLHDALDGWLPRLHPVSNILLNSRIHEELMWSAQQLGAHSPHVLLSTIFFFNSKNLKMRSVEDHSKLAFFRMQKLVKKAGIGQKERTCLLRYFPPKKKSELEAQKKAQPQTGPGGMRRKQVFDPETLDQNENLDNPLRCPVKLYEFYLSKCPESVKMRNEIFYLLPEHSCVPDSPVWYSAAKLPDEEMEKMLRRYGMVHEVQKSWQEKEKEEKEEKEKEEQEKEEREKEEREKEEREKEEREKEEREKEEREKEEREKEEREKEEREKEEREKAEKEKEQTEGQEAAVASEQVDASMSDQSTPAGQASQGVDVADEQGDKDDQAKDDQAKTE